MTTRAENEFWDRAAQAQAERAREHRRELERQQAREPIVTIVGVPWRRKTLDPAKHNFHDEIWQVQLPGLEHMSLYCRQGRWMPNSGGSTWTSRNEAMAAMAERVRAVARMQITKRESEQRQLATWLDRSEHER